MLIQVEGLGYRYAPGTPLERVALRDVDLLVEPGERVGILGPTGSGKSTLAQLIAGLLQPTAGQVLLDGISVHTGSPAARALRRQVGIAFQSPEYQIFEHTVFREVAFGLRKVGLSDAELHARVDWALGIAGIDLRGMAGRAPLTLSGGEMRRVALASILARRPRVLILDEPTASLDPKGRRDLLGRLVTFEQETGATLIVISHSLDDLARVAERVVILVDGRIAADGPVRQVLSDRRLLEQASFDVPEPVALLLALQRAGWDVPADLLHPCEAVKEIVRVIGSRKEVV
jgi:energy-coupling factor transport system ATP-binding protein